MQLALHLPIREKGYHLSIGNCLSRKWNQLSWFSLRRANDLRFPSFRFKTLKPKVPNPYILEGRIGEIETLGYSPAMYRWAFAKRNPPTDQPITTAPTAGTPPRKDHPRADVPPALIC
jgi:hypothetical protein